MITHRYILALWLAAGSYACAPRAQPAPANVAPAGNRDCATGLISPRACPSEMVLVTGRFCIDRYEAAMVDERTGAWFSPYYPPTFDDLRKAVDGQIWGMAALGKETLRPEVPPLPEWERSSNAQARAVSRAGVTPQGYVSKLAAASACRVAGKRLCELEEWTTACRGEENTTFPYGPKYHRDACNVRSRHHPAAILYGDASTGHWDPRLNALLVDGAPLLKPTGSTTTCASRWRDDAVYDMVGNIDEWVHDGKGTFAGGFYARDTVRGCDARVTEHGASYFDYSTGVRCCADL